ncbi:MAG: ABC transporter ATP-binding protein [Minisyncoccia bacterium]
MKLLWQELKRHKKILFGALVLATINQVFSLLDPQIFRLIVDNYVTKGSGLSKSQFISGVSLLLLASVGAAFASRVAKAFQDYYVNVIIQRSGTNLYAQSVSHSFSLPYAVFEDQRSGELLNKLQKARTDSQTLILNSVNILFLSIVSVVFVLVYATFVHWLVGLVFFLIFPVLGVAIWILSKKIKEAQMTIVKETASLSGSTTETLRNVELVKSLGLEEQEVKRLNTVNEMILALELKKVKMVRKLDFIQGTLTNALRSGILLMMLWLIFVGTITIGEFFTLWIYSFFVFGPLSMLGMLATNYQEAKASLNQVEKVLELKPAPVPVNAKELGEIQKIEYKNVSLQYGQKEEEQRLAVSNINLNIKAGETVAFVGPSGSGKSSMIKLLAGLYDPTSGQVLVNGIDLREINIGDLRRRIGLVAQETQLFAGTIKENLLFVRPDASEIDMINVLDIAQAKTILERSSVGGTGLEARIGEGGLKLSGGERQRLAIARALLRKPDLIVFDEATSSLDSITEKAITDTIKNIEKAHQKLITVLVAHRLSTIMHADKIYVFEKGKIVETGDHDALVKQGGLYAALWREQIAEEK